jgi:hypothetical protein
MEFTPQTYKVATLLSRIDQGEIALPEFQREFIWQPPAIADLLRTVARQWPAGTFLVLEVEERPEFAFKPINGAPPAHSPKILILDGQQRTTALYHALTERADEVYFIDMAAVLGSQAFDDEHLRYSKATRFAADYPNVEAMARKGVAKVSSLFDDLSFNQWTRYFEDAKQDAMIRVRQELLPGLREYEVPAVRLPHDVPLAAIAKIFETLNRTGVRLATFDLMVARLYPYDFRLRTQWEEVRVVYDQFQDYGVEDGVEVLKIVALDEHMRQREAGIRVTVKGVRESDVLSLEPRTAIDSWSDAAQALANALDFLHDRCGVLRRSMIPSSAMLLPLAYMLWPGRPRRSNLDDDIVRWFWATGFSQTYAQGANTQAVADARALRAWQADPSAVPEVINGFRLDEELLRDGRRRNEMLVRTLMCRLADRDARDWMDDKRFTDLDSKFEFHHVIPDEFLEKHYRGDKNPVANYALLTESTNKALRNQLPRDVLARPDVSRDAVETQKLPLKFLNKDGVEPSEYISGFLEERARLLAELINDAVR